MFVTGLTYQNIIDREPALADFDTSYATSFTGLIAEAKAVIDNRLRALGYDLDKIGKKTDVWDWDNESGTTISTQITNPDSTQNLLILVTNDSQPDTNVIVQASQGQEIINETFNIAHQSLFSFVLPYLDSVSVGVYLYINTGFEANSIKAYLTDPAIYFVHLFKSLEIIYESMRSNPGDLFEMKSLYYGDLYEREFQNLVTFYDADGDGVASLGEQISLNRTTLSR